MSILCKIRSRFLKRTSSNISKKLLSFTQEFSEKKYINPFLYKHLPFNLFQYSIFFFNLFRLLTIVIKKTNVKLILTKVSLEEIFNNINFLYLKNDNNVYKDLKISHSNIYLESFSICLNSSFPNLRHSSCSKSISDSIICNPNFTFPFLRIPLKVKKSLFNFILKNGSLKFSKKWTSILKSNKTKEDRAIRRLELFGRQKVQFKLPKFQIHGGGKYTKLHPKRKPRPLSVCKLEKIILRRKLNKMKKRYVNQFF